MSEKPVYPTVSILVPMRNEEDYIAACLASLCAQDYPSALLEIIIIDGESTDDSIEIITEIARQDPRVRLLPNPAHSQAAAMNVGITAAQGEVVARADAHAVYGPAYVRICVEHLLAGHAVNVGGLQRAEGQTPFSSALAVAFRTPLGSGNAAYRHATEQQYADTVWLGCWYRQTLRDLGGFNETLIANEDYELNLRLRARGGQVLLDPSLESTYFPRSSPRRLWRQFFRYGLGKAQVLRLHPGSLAPRQMIPPFFAAAMLLAASFAVLTPLPLAAISSVYLLAILAGSLAAAARHGLRHLGYLPLIYIIMHGAWGLGFLWGVYQQRYGRQG